MRIFNYKNILVFTLYLSTLIPVLGQESNNGNERLTKFPVFRVSQKYFSNAQMKLENINENYQADFTDIEIQMVFPLKEKKLYLFNGLYYGYKNYNINGSFFPDDIHQFHTIRYNIGCIKVLPNRRTLSLNVLPVLSSDFKDGINSDDFSYNISAMMMKKSSATFEYGLGLAYASDVTGYKNGLVVPLFAMTAKHNRFLTQMILPSSITGYYEINKTTKAGLTLAINSGLNNMLIGNNNTGLDLNRFNEFGLQVGPRFRKLLYGDFYLDLNAGISFANTLTIQDSDMNSELEIKGENRFFISIGLILLK